MTSMNHWSRRPHEQRAAARELAQRALSGDYKGGLTALARSYVEAAKKNNGRIPCGD